MSRVAMVTGGTRGIGRAIVEALLAFDYKVAFTGTTSDGVVKAERAFNGAVGIVADSPRPGAGSSSGEVAKTAPTSVGR